MLSVDTFQILGIEPPLPGYRVEDVQSEVLVNLKGLLVTMNGTVQQIYQQILEINPEYESEFGPVWNATAPTPDEIWRANFAAERRETWSDCGHWDPARAEAIWEGINHLNHVSGRPLSRPGPGVCGRVSCSYDSAIWWCNDVRIKFSPFPAGLTAPTLATQTNNLTLMSVTFGITTNLINNRDSKRNHYHRITRLPPQSSLSP